jgi:glycosyltransferase involved in cell wall biosynthesis
VSPELSVVVPVHNEADNIASLLAEIRSALDGLAAYEVVCVDDGSDDDTPRLLAGLSAEFPELRVVRHRARAGQSAAIAHGVRVAQGTWIATLDGDGQNDPADIPRLLAIIRDPHAPSDLRLLAGERSRRLDPWVKRFAGRVANRVRARLLDDETSDSGCGLKLFSRDCFLAVPHFDHMHRFLPALFLRSGWRVASVPVNHRPRRHGRSHYGVFDRLWAGLADLAGVLWLQHRPIDPGIEEYPHD